MAQFIPVDGPVGPDESFAEVMFQRMRLPNGCLVSFEYLATGQTLLSRLDVTSVNPAATDLAGGKTIYGDAILYREHERTAD
jgi:hypothetical protein